jgi:hypothetical protein
MFLFIKLGIYLIYKIMYLVFPRITKDEKYYQAKMTENQFIALKEKIHIDNIYKDLLELDYWRRLNKSIKFDDEKTKQFLFNSWSTECLLNYNANFSNNAFTPYTLHWAFPQAYYSVFMSILAFFNAIGFSEYSHTSVLKKIGYLIQMRKYPPSTSFYSIGGMKEIKIYNLLQSSDESSIKLDINIDESIDKHIAQLLKSTRQIHLKEQKENMRNSFICKNGNCKKNLDEKDWNKVSDSIGITTIYNFLYRKRIKSNYKDIMVFFHESIDSMQLLLCLTKIVYSLNFITEFYLFNTIGKNLYYELLKLFDNKTFDMFEQRYEYYLTFKK